jgi:hypothetical protein
LDDAIYLIFQEEIVLGAVMPLVSQLQTHFVFSEFELLPRGIADHEVKSPRSDPGPFLRLRSKAVLLEKMGLERRQALNLSCE